jgi:hypothetical protein
LELGIKSPDEIDIDAIAMDRGALVLVGGISGAAARLARSQALSFIRINRDIRELGRKRFAIAHEIGHLLLHDGRSQFALCTDKDLLSLYTNSPDELEASAFAAALLMPASMFQPTCKGRPPSMALVSELANSFNVSLTAAAVRYVQFCPHRCCIVLSADNRVRYHRAGDEFGYFIEPHSLLDRRTFASDFFHGDELPRGMQGVAAAAWLNNSQIGSSQRIMEDSIGMPTYNSVLTLLWIDHDIDGPVAI